MTIAAMIALWDIHLRLSLVASQTTAPICTMLLLAVICTLSESSELFTHASCPLAGAAHGAYISLFLATERGCVCPSVGHAKV